MTPFRSNHRGTFVVKRVFAGVGEIRRASGTTDRRLYRQLDEMLSTLYQGGRLDVLELVRDGQLKLLECWKHYRLGDWKRLPTAYDFEPLVTAFTAWIEHHTCSEQHRQSLRASADALTAIAGKAATISDLPAAVARYREQCDGKARTFNLARSAARTFLKHKTGRYSRLWQDVSNVPPMEVTAKRRKHPKLPDEARAIRHALNRNAGDMWWSLCTSGMRVRAEYLAGQWRVQENHIVIKTAKHDDASRMVPLIWRAVQPALTYWGFRQALRKLEDEVTAHDARRTYMQFLREAGIPRIRRKLYLGHSVGEVSDLYEWHEVKKFLAADAKKLRTYLSEPAVLEAVG